MRLILAPPILDTDQQFIDVEFGRGFFVVFLVFLLAGIIGIEGKGHQYPRNGPRGPRTMGLRGPIMGGRGAIGMPRMGTPIIGRRPAPSGAAARAIGRTGPRTVVVRVTFRLGRFGPRIIRFAMFPLPYLIRVSPSLLPLTYSQMLGACFDRLAENHHRRTIDVHLLE